MPQKYKNKKINRRIINIIILYAKFYIRYAYIISYIENQFITSLGFHKTL